MNKKEIVHIIHMYFGRLAIHFRKIKKNMSPETIKPFRIEIKKLRAFLRLLSVEIGEPSELELDGELKDMHKSGGRFRDLHLHRQRVLDEMKEKKGITFSRELAKIGLKDISKEKKHFLAGDGFKKTEKKILHRIPEQYDTATIKEFFRSRMEIIEGIIRKARYTDKEMHNIRKKLKDVLYIIKLYRADLRKPLGFRFWDQAKLQKIKDIEDQLGFLNDTRNALMLLEPETINAYKAEDKKLLNSIRRKLLREKKERRTKLISSLKVIVQSSN